MAHLPLTDSDTNLVLCQRLAGLARAASVDELLREIQAIAVTLCQAQALQVAWHVDGDLELMGESAATPRYLPTPAEQERLREAELLCSELPGGGTRYLVPLRLHDAPRGWMLLEGSALGAEGLGLLELLGAQLTLALAALQTERQARQLSSLNRIGRLITSSLNAEQMPQLIMEQATRLIDAEEGSLLLADESTGELVFTYTTGPSGLNLLGQRIPRGSGIAGFVFDTGRSEIVNDVARDTRFYDQVDAQSGIVTRSLLAVALHGRASIVGVIEVINKRSGRPFDTDDRLLLESLASQAVIALENARRFSALDEDLTRRAQELALSNSRLREIVQIGHVLRAERRLADLLGQIAGGVRRCTDFTSARICLVRRQGVRLPVLEEVGADDQSLPSPWAERLPLDAVEALLQPQRQLSDAVFLLPAAAARAGGLRPPGDADLVLCPLRAGDGQLLGMLTVYTLAAGARPPLEQIQLLEIFATQAATAIENASLYDRLQHNLQSLTALNALSMALNSTLRAAPQIVSLSTAGAVASTSALGAVVLLVDPLNRELAQVFSSGPRRDPQLDALAARVVESQRSELIAAGDAHFPATVRQAGGQSAMAVPLRATRAVLGAMIVYFVEENPLLSAQETLVLFAGQAAVAIESLQLMDALQQGRDRLASIMASTREGMLMLDGEGRVAVTNAALRRLCGVEPLVEGQALRVFLALWRRRAAFAEADWRLLEAGITEVGSGRVAFADGQLSQERPRRQALEWVVLPVRAEGLSGNGVLLVLRDITAAKEAEQLRQDLTNMIVHDLRSPISSVMAALDLLARGIPGELQPRQRSVLTIAYKSSQHLLGMVNVLLDISRLEGGSMPLHRSPVALQPLISQAAQNLGPLAEERRVHLRLELGADLPRVLADGALIERVCQNLIDNGVKFSGVGGEVRVSAYCTEQAALPVVVVAVQDRGVGIRPEDQARIFEKFGQVGERRGGSGLGLTFCQLVVEAHAGRIWVESQAGQGSTFFFSLPLA